MGRSMTVRGGRLCGLVKGDGDRYRQFGYRMRAVLLERDRLATQQRPSILNAPLD